MIYKNINKIKEDQFRGKSIIAIDFGTKRFGIAISDSNQTIATPKLNYERKNIEKDIKRIYDLLIELDTNLILLGLPKNLDNSSITTTQQVKSFANILLKKLNVDIFYWDERYSSKAAMDITKHKEFDGKKDDKIAATIILQTFLNFVNNF